MDVAAPKAVLSQETFGQLRDLIYERTGIRFADNKKYLLESRLARRLEERNCPDFEAYYHFLKYDPDREREMTALYNVVTTNETSFFRDMPQLSAFAEGVLAEILQNGAGASKALKIWSAACSTGEEPYTLAMMAAEKGILSRGWRLEILATDISEMVLKSAQRGLYGEYAIRNTPEQYLKKYFAQEGSSYAVRPEMRDLVRFQHMNLVDPSRMKVVRGMDVVFCRNVLIYFDEAAKKKVVASLYDSLNPKGYLFIGHSESLHTISRAFKLVTVNKMLVYQKA